MSKPLSSPRLVLLLCFFSLITLGFHAAEEAAKDDVNWAEGKFAGTHEEVLELVKIYDEIDLTPEQEKIRLAALDDMPAPCCNNFSAATCCCECNLSRSLWGLSKHLIVNENADAAMVRQAAEAWVANVNPDGFPGNTCTSGRCPVPMNKGGCGGMNKHHVSSGK